MGAKLGRSHAAALRIGVVVEAQIRNLLHIFALSVLRLKLTEMHAHAPINSPNVRFRISVHRKAPHQHDAAPVFQFIQQAIQLA